MVFGSKRLKTPLAEKSNLKVTEWYGEWREGKEQAEEAKAVVCMVIAERTEEDVKAASKMNVEEASKRDAETASKVRCRNKHPKPKILESKPELRNLSPEIWTDRKKSGCSKKRTADECADKGKQSESEKKKQNIRKNRDFNRRNAKKVKERK